MSDQTFLQIQALELRQLLKGAGDDPILAPQLRDRLEEVGKELEACSKDAGVPVELARAAIFLRGGGVQDSLGISATLAGEALIQYEKMFTAQALHDEREAARNAGRQRRPSGAAYPGLLFTGTPRGSFGLEFVAQPTEAGMVVHAQSLRNVADALIRVADSTPASIQTTIEAIPLRVLQPLQKLMKTLASYGAELRLAFPDLPSKSLPIEQLKQASELLEREISEESIEIVGVFRGVTLESGMFDVRIETGEVITGTVADWLTEDDLKRIGALLNQECTAILQKTTVRRVTGPPTTSYVLLDARPTE